ncbi:MAG: hypothetical protein KBT36_15935 [Kurthia sp.]|nr:hypothetical protein [Candidatus Kurthia equi]
MLENKKQEVPQEKIAYHYPLVDIEKKQVKCVVTIADRLYLSASVDLSNGMIHVEKNLQDFEADNLGDHQMIEEIKMMAEFIILNQVEGYGNSLLN